MLALSTIAMGQSCPVINATAVNTNGPGNYAITINYTADPGLSHFNMVTFCSTNPLPFMFTTTCIPVNGSGTTVVDVQCDGTPIVILVPVPGACEEGFPCGLPTFVFGPVGGPLPIKMQDFYATRTNNNVKLSWNTALEINAKEFVIEAKTGSDFVALGSIEATNRTEGSKYEYIHFNTEKEVTLYRIKMVDLDGTYRYSETRAVSGIEKAGGFTIFPNPTYGNAQLTITDVTSETEVQVIDNSGRMVRRMQMNNSNSLNINNLQKGLYMIRVIDKTTGEVQTKKLAVLN